MFNREMGRGFGRGMGSGYGRGMGLAFRGSSPPWPYVGRGRGGMPRCRAFTGYGAPVTPYDPGMVPSGPRPYGAASYSREEEIRFMKGRAEMIRDELAAIDSRIKELEKEKTQGGES